MSASPVDAILTIKHLGNISFSHLISEKEIFTETKWYDYDNEIMLANKISSLKHIILKVLMLTTIIIWYFIINLAISHFSSLTLDSSCNLVILTTSGAQ